MDAVPSPMPEDPPARDWSLLPLDALSSIFIRVGAVDVLMGAGLVCRSWLQAAKLPDAWRVVDMEKHEVVLDEDPDDLSFRSHNVLHAMAKEAVDRSGGQLQVFAGKEFVTAELILYIVERSPLLTTLRLVSCSGGYTFGKRLAGVLGETPLSELRCLELDSVDVSVGELTTILENCPALEVLKLTDCLGIDDEDEHALQAKFARIESLIIEHAGFSDCDVETGADMPDYGYW